MRIHKCYAQKPTGFTAPKTACGLAVRPPRLILRYVWSQVTCRRCLASRDAPREH